MTGHPHRKISLITGAGFSKQISREMPTINELTSLVLANQDIDTSIRQAKLHPERFAAQKNMNNIETLLQVIEESTAYINDYAQVLNRQALIRTIEREIVRVISKISFELNIPSDNMDALKYLIQSKINILTTNYDLIFETAIRELVLQKAIPDMSAYAMNEGLFDLGHMRQNAAWFGSDDSAMFDLSRVYKLHGSCDWFSFNTSNDDKMYIDTSRLKNSIFAAQAAKTKENLKNMSPVIAPPTTNKRTEIHALALRNIWSSAFSALRDTEALIIFGSALHETDTSLNAMLIEGVKPGLPIYLFDVNPGPIKKRIEQLFSTSVVVARDPEDLSNLVKVIEELISQ